MMTPALSGPLLTRIRLAGLALLGLLAAATAGGRPPLELFAMDNGVGRTAWPATQQAAVLRELGYQGISYNYTTPAALEAGIAAMRDAGLTIYGLYFGSRLSEERLLPEGLEQAITLLQGSRTALWLILPNASRPGDHEAEALRRIRAIADLAAPAGLRVVLYPHKGFYLATAEHAYDLALKSERANVGVTVNLAHELAAGNGMRLPEIIRKVSPLLELVSINGASDRAAGGWDNHIKLLGDGDYDVTAVVNALLAVRYRGAVGLQFYNVKGEARDNLAASQRAWSALPVATTR